MKTKLFPLLLACVFTLALASSCTRTVEDDGGLVITVKVDTTEIEDINYRDNIQSVIMARLASAEINDPVFEWINDSTYVVRLPKFHDRETAERLLTAEAKFVFYKQFNEEDMPAIKRILEELNKVTADGTDSLANVAPTIHQWNGDIVLHSAEVKDTAAINKFIFSERGQEALGKNVKLAWTIKPEERECTDAQHNRVNKNLLDLLIVDAHPLLTGEVITDAIVEFEQSIKRPCVLMKMNDEGTRKWADITEEANKNNHQCIAMDLDDQVYTYPHVNGRID
ncbi:MAG: hypothetical protein J6X70_05385, partial [Muribaculaceae bacterium]|nr:hypothetical protein [Muribaculaceae bacterium]